MFTVNCVPNIIAKYFLPITIKEMYDQHDFEL